MRPGDRVPAKDPDLSGNPTPDPEPADLNLADPRVNETGGTVLGPGTVPQSWIVDGVDIRARDVRAPQLRTLVVQGTESDVVGTAGPSDTGVPAASDSTASDSSAGESGARTGSAASGVRPGDRVPPKRPPGSRPFELEPGLKNPDRLKSSVRLGKARQGSPALSRSDVSDGGGPRAPTPPPGGTASGTDGRDVDAMEVDAMEVDALEVLVPAEDGEGPDPPIDPTGSSPTGSSPTGSSPTGTSEEGGLEDLDSDSAMRGDGTALDFRPPPPPAGPDRTVPGPLAPVEGSLTSGSGPDPADVAPGPTTPFPRPFASPPSQVESDPDPDADGLEDLEADDVARTEPGPLRRSEDEEPEVVVGAPGCPTLSINEYGIYPQTLGNKEIEAKIRTYAAELAGTLDAADGLRRNRFLQQVGRSETATVRSARMPDNFYHDTLAQYPEIRDRIIEDAERVCRQWLGIPAEPTDPTSVGGPVR